MGQGNAKDGTEAKRLDTENVTVLRSAREKIDQTDRRSGRSVATVCSQVSGQIAFISVRHSYRLSLVANDGNRETTIR